MKAVVLTDFGESDVLRLQEVDEPTPRESEVLVRVHATTINDYDWAFMRGRPLAYRPFMGFSKPRVTILGAEVAGRVEAVGGGVTMFASGDEVYGDISEAGFGGFAEYVCVKETALVRKPAAMSFEEAASLPHAAALAMQGLIDRAGIHKGEKVLINGAGGGVGTLGVQIARTFDAETTGVDSAAKFDTMRAAGFDDVIDYQREDFTRSGRRYDLILDTKTTRSPARCARALRPGGRYMTVGGDVPRLLQHLLLGPLVSRATKKRFGIVALKTNKDLDRVNALFETGKLRCFLDNGYRLADIPAAVQRFGKAEHTGKIVISVREPSNGG